MPLTELDPNTSGRNSRGSNLSAQPKNVRKRSSSGTVDMLSNNPSIYGMLKTTTETGDLGLLSMRSNKLPAIPKGVSRKTAHIDLSRTPSHYSYSHSHHESIHSRRTSGYSGGEASLLPPRHLPTRLHGLQSLSSSGSRSTPTSESHRSLTSHAHNGLDSKKRSYSLTSQQPPPLPYHRSLTSLRGSAASMKSRSPNAYPTRLRRPGFRPDSPALSDIVGLENRYVDRMRRKITPFPQPAMPYGPIHANGRQINLRSPDPVLSRAVHNLNASADMLLLTTDDTASCVVESSNSSEGEITRPPISTSDFRSPRDSLRPEFSSQNSSQLHRGKRNIESSGTFPLKAPASQSPGFVQRVKTILEEKISLEKFEHRPIEWKVVGSSTAIPVDIIELPASPVVRCVNQNSPKVPCDQSCDSASALPEGADTIDAILLFQDDDVQSSFHLQTYKAEDRSSSAQLVEALNGSSSDFTTLESSPEIATDEDNMTMRFSIPGSYPLPLEDQKASNKGDRGLLCQERRPRTSDITNIDAEICAGGLSEATIRDIEDAIQSQSTIKKPSTLEIPVRSSVEDSHTQIVVDGEDKYRRSYFTPQIFVSSATTSTNASVDTSHSQSLLYKAPLPRSHPTSSQLSSKEHDSLGGIYRKSDYSCSSLLEDAQSNIPSSSKSTKSGSNSRRTSSVPEVFVFTDPDTEIPQIQDRQSNKEIKFSILKTARSILPDLTEDSQEDASATNLRILGSKTPFSKNVFVKPIRDNPMLPHQNSGIIKLPASYLARSLTGDLNMPTLNFSRMDLLSKLNLALGLLSSRSLEDLRSSNLQEITGLMHERSASTEMIRTGSTKLFSIDSVSALDREKKAREPQVRSIAEDLIIEINRLSIPSVNGLTQRLSDLLPTIKDTDLTRDGPGKHISLCSSVDLKSSIYPSTVISSALDCLPPSASSERRQSRPVTGNEISILATDTTSRDISTLRLMKELPPLPIEIPQDNSNKNSDQSASTERLKSAETDPTLTIAELEAPITTYENAPQGDFSNQKPGSIWKKARPEVRHRQSLDGSPPSSRPWNLDENYTWSEGSPSVEIVVPHSLNRQAAAGWNQGRDRLRRSKSAADLPMPLEDSVRIARSMSPGPVFHANLVPNTDTIIEIGKPGNGKKNILGSISRKIGIRTKVDRAGFPLDPDFLHPEDCPLNPGDRYPTSSLSPPVGMMTLEEARSYFSDDSAPSERQKSGVLRKRITRLKPKMSALKGVSPRESRSDVQRVRDDSVMDETTRDLDFEGAKPTVMITPPGMSKVEFRAKKVVEKLRILWYKSGELIRSMGKARKDVPSWYDDGDMYSGV